MDLISVMLYENPRRIIRRALAAGTLKAAIVPTGSTEQHNEHLAMSHDTDSAVHVSRLAAEKLRPSTIVTTPLAIGISEHWMDFHGTLTLTAETFGQVLAEVCESVSRHGIRNILVVNGHAGNHCAIANTVPEVSERLGINIEGCSYWESYSTELVEEHMESKQCPAHAAEFETSFGLAAFPQNVHFTDEPYPADEMSISSEVRSENDPIYHRDAKLATAEKGQAMIDVAADWLAEKVKEMIEG